MARRVITFLSSIAVVASLNLSPAYAQRGASGTHPVTPQVKSDSHGTESHGSESHGSSSTTPKSTLTVAQRIDAHPQLVSRLTPLLPSGMTLDQAAAGFKNQGQFIAALHVSKNLNIPFDQLKTEMTGPDHLSLGKAIEKLQPAANAKSAVKTAETEARTDLKAGGTKTADTDKDGK